MKQQDRIYDSYKELPSTALWKAERVNARRVTFEVKGSSDFAEVTWLFEHNLPHLHIRCETCNRSNKKFQYTTYIALFICQKKEKIFLICSKQY